jgi:hypothetical protein
MVVRRHGLSFGPYPELSLGSRDHFVVAELLQLPVIYQGVDKLQNLFQGEVHVEDLRVFDVCLDL